MAGEKIGISSCLGGEGKLIACLPAAWIWSEVVGLKLAFTWESTAVDAAESTRLSVIELLQLEDKMGTIAIAASLLSGVVAFIV